MTILTKILNNEQLNNLDLLLSGALAPLEGYLDQADHCSVLQQGRLANGYLWPLPLTLQLSPLEKRTAQITGRIALLDADKRPLGEVQVTELYRLPPDAAALTGADANSWYAAGKVEALAKILHPTFNRIRHQIPALRSDLKDKGWKSVVAVHAAPELVMADMQQACEWLKSTTAQGIEHCGMLIQIHADERAKAFHDQIRDIRAQVRCSVARQIKLSLLPLPTTLSPTRSALLQALIARNQGATGFVVTAHTEKSVLRYLLQHRDEIGLDIIPVRHATIKKVSKALTEDGLQPTQQLEAALKLAA